MKTAPSPSAGALAFARLSTSVKILIVLTLALLPLGVIASLASLETAQANRANREAAARLLASDAAERFTLATDRAASLLHDAQRDGNCARAARAIGPGATIAIFGQSGKLVCATSAFTPSLPLRAPGSTATVMLDPQGEAVRVLTAAVGRPGWSLAILPRDLLERLTHPHALDGSYALTLRDRDGVTLKLASIQATPLDHATIADLPVAGGQLRLRMEVMSQPLSANEILLTLLPILMWVAGGAIGWLVVDRLILRPLATMQQAIDTYRVTGRFEPPPLTTPAFEIRTLGRAFQLATQTIARHEADLEDGLARQTRLTREVHHRVKNNLQVVASLLNIHARGAAAPGAADAYATIQRRVDALALVHRSHYAEMEVNHGVALRPLIGELAANMRGSLPDSAAPPRISLELTQAHVSQDVAVAVAFLLVEVMETAMLRVPGTEIFVSTCPVDNRVDRLRLTVRSPALMTDAAPDSAEFQLFERVVTGLARQLRTPLDRDDSCGTMAVEIAVMALSTT